MALPALPDCFGPEDLRLLRETLVAVRHAFIPSTRFAPTVIQLPQNNAINVAAYDLKRKLALIVNPSTNTSIYQGTTATVLPATSTGSTGGQVGTLLPAGSSFIWGYDYLGDVYLVNGATTTQTIYVMTMREDDAALAEMVNAFFGV